MQQKKTANGGLLTLGVAALFLAAFLALVLLGTQSYLRCVRGQTDNQGRRVIPASLSAGLHAFDSAEAVNIRQTAEGAVLELRDGETGYALRYYLVDGKLYTDYARLGSDPQPENAQLLGETATFELTRLDGGLLSITTDQGRTLCRLRSEGGAP